jgi:NADPH:quinone reductase-like Zn-dependent oxidoreductase
VPQDVIEAVHFETPPLQAGQALVEVVAALINPADVLTLTGEYGQLPPLPAIGGREGVGRVAELRSDTGDVAVGQLVLLPVGCGSWSSYVVTEVSLLRPLPDQADPLQLSMMTINPPTAALLLSEFMTLGPGDWVIQNAPTRRWACTWSSWPDTVAIGLSTSFGAGTRRRSCARPAATSSSSTARTLAKRVVDATGGAAVRLGIDAMGGTASGRLADSLCESATLVSYGRMCGEPCAIRADAFVFRDLTLRGFWLVNWFRRTPEHQRRVLLDEIAGLITMGRLHAPIHAIYDVSEVKKAAASAASGERSGKILIVPRR